MEIRTIVTGVDFSAESSAAAATAIMLARSLGASVVLVHALAPPLPDGATRDEAVQAYERAAVDHRNDAEHKLHALRQRLVTPGVAVGCRMVEGAADEVLCEVAREVDAELLVVSTHGRSGLSRLLLGSVAQRVVRAAPCSVLVARSAHHPPFRKLLVPIDFSPEAELALTLASVLAAPEAVVGVIHVGPASERVDEPPGARLDAARDAGCSLIGRHRRDGVRLWFDVVPGHADVVIPAQARAHTTDLIVMGSHGRRGLRRALIGSVAEAVVRTAPCSVLVVRSPVD